MIQRIQSLWLLLSALAILLLFKVPYFTAAAAPNAVPETLTVGKSLPLFILTAILGILPLAAIFLYRNRGTQKRIIWVSLLGCLLLIALVYFKAEDLLMAKATATLNNASYSLGALFPVLYILFLILAFSAIRKDEKLIKSVDRLR